MKLIEEGFIKRNKKIILIAVAIMLLSAIGGAAISYVNTDGQHNTISNELSAHHTKNNTDIDLGMNATDLFIHNVIADLIVIIGGFLFSIISVILVIYNGFSIGIPFGFDLPYAMVSILPHAIIEYFAGSLALAIAFKITKLEIQVIKNRNVRNTIDEHKTDLKDILVLLIVMIILLGIAAFIEGNITGMVVKSYFGL